MAEDGDYTAALRGSNSDHWQAVKPPASGPARAGGTNSGAGFGGGCYRCGDLGHWSRDCPMPAGNAGKMPAAPTSAMNPGAVASKPCPCGAGMCVVRTSSTARNPGRQFLACPAPQDAKCKFFEWCDAAGTSPAKAASQPQQQQNTAGEKELNCAKCNQPCPVFTARTEKNPGRRFYKCKNEACNFFKWCDEALAPAPSSLGFGRGNNTGGYGRSSSSYGGAYGGSGMAPSNYGGSDYGTAYNAGGGYGHGSNRGSGNRNYEDRGNTSSHFGGSGSVGVSIPALKRIPAGYGRSNYGGGYGNT